MEIIATQRSIRQAPRKVRLVANTVKSMPLEQAIRQLAVMQRAASIPVLKTLRQAVANAQNNHGISPDQLEIASLLVNDGSIFKRWRAVSRGRAHSIFKRSCHVVVKLRTKAAKPATQAPEVTAEAVASTPVKTDAVQTTAKKTTKVSTSVPAAGKSITPTKKSAVKTAASAKADKKPTRTASKKTA